MSVNFLILKIYQVINIFKISFKSDWTATTQNINWYNFFRKLIFYDIDKCLATAVGYLGIFLSDWRATTPKQLIFLFCENMNVYFIHMLGESTQKNKWKSIVFCRPGRRLARILKKTLLLFLEKFFSSSSVNFFPIISPIYVRKIKVNFYPG